MADSAQKTEQPTPKKKKEAHEKGNIAKSADLGAWAGMLATTVLIQMTISRGGQVFPNMIRDMARAMAKPDQAVASRFAVNAMWQGAGVAAPLLIGLLVVAVVSGLSQVGLKPSMKRLKPDFKRLNPLKGLKKLVSMQSWWEVAKSVAKIAILAIVVTPAMTTAITRLTSTPDGGLGTLAGITAQTALQIVRNVSFAGLAVAGVDYIVQRRRINKELKMSRQEIRDEMKLSEGNPEIKRAIRSRQMAVSRNRMINMVGQSDVIVVNPTHYAVALRYDKDVGAPQVVAKGGGAIAARIRAEAEKHHVPIVREPVLARTLFKSCKVGQLIPLDLYEAVAHLLAFVFGLRAKGRAQGFHDLTGESTLVA